MAALTEEQSIIRDQAKAWATDVAPITAFRAVRDGGAVQAYDDVTWQQMIEMGWTGILVPETYGGSDLGYLTFGVVLEELGRQLTASPLFASSLVGASTIVLAGTDAQKSELLPGVVDGSAVLTLAVDEDGRHNPAGVALQADKTANGYRLNGHKSFVLEGLSASHFIVVARTAGKPGERDGLTLFLVPAEATQRSPQKLMDSRGYAGVRFDDVTVAADAVLGEPDNGADILDAVLDRGRAGLGAEMMGVGATSFEMTLEYLQTRKQFGAVIGSFQALGHRAAELYSSMELARSCAEAALQALDAGAENTQEMVSLSKAQVGEFLHFMSNQLIQIHGGIGMTDEFDAGLLLKRSRTLEATFGNRAFHRDRYATLLGF